MKSLKTLFILMSFFVNAQTGFHIDSGNKTEIKFQFINNLILIPIEVNGTQLTFLLDSGVNETLLFSIDNKDINLNNVEKTNFTGLGKDVEVEGLKSSNNVVKIGKNMIDKEHALFIILDESINFSDRVGIPVNGIIGYSFFKNHPVKIDFKSNKITVYNDIDLLKNKLNSYEEFPITIELNKPYMHAEVELTNQKQDSKLLIDLGNTDGVWLFPSLADKYLEHHPHIHDFLGRGFNGDIFGERARIHGIYLKNFYIEKPLVAVPNQESIQHLTKVKDREGSIGSEIWRRFSFVMDYPNQKLYLKKNRDFKDLFLFNKSGLEIKHSGMFWEQDWVKINPDKTEIKQNDNKQSLEVYTNPESKFQYKFVLKPQFSISECRQNAPCDKAGMKKDDQLISINGKNTANLNLQTISRMLREGQNGAQMDFEIKRGAIIQKKTITLEDPIPYEDNGE